MKKLVLAAAFAVLGATAASAQVELRAGPGGVGIGVDRDRGERTTVIHRDRDWDRGDRTVIRRERGIVTGSTGCRTIIVKERDDFGRRVTKRIHRC